MWFRRRVGTWPAVARMTRPRPLTGGSVAQPAVSVRRMAPPIRPEARDAPRDVRRERVERRNRDQGATFSMVVPPAIFELASDMWEPLDDDERAGRDVRDVGDSAPA